MEPYFEISENGKIRRFTIAGRHGVEHDRSFEISSNSSTNVYVAVLDGSYEEKVLGNLNVSREDFIDGMLGMFPELRRAE